MSEPSRSVSRRRFTALGAAAAIGGSSELFAQQSPDAEGLRMEFLFDLLLEPGPARVPDRKLTSLTAADGALYTRSTTLAFDESERIIQITGGSVKGPKLTGTVTGGGDWVVRRPDGVVELNVQISLHTDDGQAIAFWYRGLSYEVEPGKRALRLYGGFETTAKKYDWLNKVVAVGHAQTIPGKVVRRFYHMT